MTQTIPNLREANFIGGQWRPSVAERTYERRNPWRPSEVVGEFPRSNAGDVAAAVDAAYAALPAWSAMPAAARGAILGRAADLILERVEDIAQD